MAAIESFDVSSFKRADTSAYTIVQDANLQTAGQSWLGCILTHASSEFQSDLALSVQTSPEVQGLRAKTIHALRTLRAEKPELAEKVDAHFTTISSIEKELIPFFTKGSKGQEDLQDDALGQLTFQGEWFQCFNHIPWLIASLCIFKIWVVPTMTILFPVLAWILPYLLLKFVYYLPITTDQYSTILQHLWSGNLTVPPMGFAEDGKPALPSIWTPKSIAQFLFFGFTFAQSIYQPIQNAMHLYTTDGIICKMGSYSIDLRNRLRSLQTICEAAGGQIPSLKNAIQALDELQTEDIRRSFSLLYDQPERLHMGLRAAARMEILWRLSGRPELFPVKFYPDSAKATLQLEDALDISLENGVPSSISLGPQKGPHAVVTGPNGGGKSSFLRAVLQSVLFGHAYGYAPAKKAQLPRVRWIASGLQLHDTPGVLSMFETEVFFASSILRRMKDPSQGIGLVLFDELFHSTNPPDGTRTAKLFLKQLWAETRSVVSVVSTHVFPLVEGAGPNVQAVCCKASASPEGILKFSYRLEPGICKVSSVRSVWERFGLSRASASVAASVAAP
jgi:hypothetical protein